MIGRNYVSNLCMARSLSLAGYKVEILRIFQKKPTWKNKLGSVKSESKSKYVKKHYICVTNGDNERVVERLREIGRADSKALLLPNDDFCASIVDYHLDELSQWYLMPNVCMEQGKINELMNKQTQKRLARNAGIPTVKFHLIEVQAINDRLHRISYPCFIKPNISNRQPKRMLRKCKDEKELMDAFNKLSATPDLEVLVEEGIYVRREYSMLGISTKEGAYSPGIFVVEKGGHKERKGTTVLGRVLSCENLQPLVDQIDAFVSTLNMEGLFDVDLIEAEDGTIYFSELNMRFGGAGYAITASGVNLPGMFADYMFTGKLPDRNVEVTAGKQFVNEKIMQDEYIKGYLSYKDVKRHMKEADIYFVKDKNDKYPYRCLQRYYLLVFMKKAIHAVKSKIVK